jgi:hypothetical protein
MSIFALSLLIQIALVIHVIKTGRNTLWIWVVLLLPIAGPIAYFAVEIAPTLLQSRTARQVAQQTTRLVSPRRALREATSFAAVTDTVEAKAKLAAAQTARGSYVEAMATCRAGLRGLYEFDATLLLALAEAQFKSGDALAASTSLRTLFDKNPEFTSPEGRLLFARALEASDQLACAKQEYAGLLGRYPGLEATVRYAQLLLRLGDSAKANALFDEVVQGADIAPPHVKRAQAEWIGIARRARGR